MDTRLKDKTTAALVYPLSNALLKHNNYGDIEPMDIYELLVYSFVY